MKSQLNEKFLKNYRKLPDKIRQQARKAYRLFLADPYHPSLHFKRVRSSLPIYSARVSKDYRVLGILSDDTIVWFWIGSHSDYDQLLSSL